MFLCVLYIKICWFVYLGCLFVFLFFGSKKMELDVFTALAITFESGLGSLGGVPYKYMHEYIYIYIDPTESL